MTVTRRVAPRLALAIAALLGGAGCGDDPVAAPGACAYGETRAAVITGLAFTRQEPEGVAPGFDLDGRVSADSDSRSCGKPDFVSPDGVPGIDNQLALLVPDVEMLVGNAVDGLVQGAINDGQLVILFEMMGVDDFADDPCVNLRVEVGVKDPPSLGTDGVIEAWQTYDVDPATEVSRAEAARIDGGVLTAGPFELAVPIAIFDVAFTLHFHRAFFRFAIAEDGTMSGHLGGGLDPDEIVAGVGQGAGLQDIVPAMGVVMRASADLAQNDEGKCEQISAAFAFTATPGFLRR